MTHKLTLQPENPLLSKGENIYLVIHYSLGQQKLQHRYGQQGMMGKDIYRGFSIGQLVPCQHLSILRGDATIKKDREIMFDSAHDAEIAEVHSYSKKQLH
jgi:hypothetical protein